MREIFDIFIGGPMGDKGEDASGVPYAQHMSVLGQAVAKIADELNARQTEFLVRVNTPEVDETGLITERVFGMIDVAELAIMDVSASSPSVMYELAMLHALGVPTIPLDLRRDEGAPLPFYLRHVYATFVERFDAQSLYDVLQSKIENTVLRTRGGAVAASNPITNYYGLPLVDVSASTGLATVYFHNFIRPVIRATGGVFSVLDDELDQLVIIRPDNLNSVEGLGQKVKNALKRAGFGHSLLGSDDGETYADRTHVRGQLVLFRSGRYLFDTPAPLVAQKSSPRFKRISKLLLETRGPDSEEAESLVQKFEANMIDQFLNTVMFLARTYPSSDPNLLVVKTLDEFLEMRGG